MVGSQSLLLGFPTLRSESQEIMTHVICALLVPWPPSGEPQSSPGNEGRLLGGGDVCAKRVDEQTMWLGGEVERALGRGSSNPG